MRLPWWQRITVEVACWGREYLAVAVVAENYQVFAGGTEKARVLQTGPTTQLLHTFSTSYCPLFPVRAFASRHAFAEQLIERPAPDGGLLFAKNFVSEELLDATHGDDFSKRLKVSKQISGSAEGRQGGISSPRGPAGGCNVCGGPHWMRDCPNRGERDDQRGGGYGGYGGFQGQSGGSSGRREFRR